MRLYVGCALLVWYNATEYMHTFRLLALYCVLLCCVPCSDFNASEEVKFVLVGRCYHYTIIVVASSSLGITLPFLISLPPLPLSTSPRHEEGLVYGAQTQHRHT